MKIHLLRNYVLVRPDKAKETTKGGLHLPESVQDREEIRCGTVLDCGPGAFMERHLKHCPVGLKEGTRVIYAKYSGSQLKDLGDDTVLLREEDIIAIVEDKP